jgi:hypothetical protein
MAENTVSEFQSKIVAYQSIKRSKPKFVCTNESDNKSNYNGRIGMFSGITDLQKSISMA